MALDIGARTIGIAISDPLQITARPLTTLFRSDLSRDCKALSNLISENEIEKLVVGMPRHLGGEKSSVSELIEPLVERLRGMIDLPIDWAEERLSTKTAEDLMSQAGLTVPERRKRKHEFSAAVILQWYLHETPSANLG